MVSPRRGQKQGDLFNEVARLRTLLRRNYWRVDKLKVSRDKWRSRARFAENRARWLAKSRDHWRERAHAAEWAQSEMLRRQRRSRRRVAA